MLTSADPFLGVCACFWMETDNLRNTDNARILLIDDDDASCRDLALLLDFLGEHAVGARHSNWRVVMAEAFETSNAIKLVLVSPCATEAMTSLVKALHASDRSLPIVLVGTEDTLSQLPAELTTLPPYATSRCSTLCTRRRSIATMPSVCAMCPASATTTCSAVWWVTAPRCNAFAT